MQDLNKLVTDNIDLWTSTIQSKLGVGRGSSKKQTLYGIRKLRELILELAVRGKLVPQDENDEPASVLLERIAADKDRLVKEKKIKKQQALPDFGEPKKLFKLPKNWEWTILQDIAEINPRNSVDDNLQVSFVTMPHISNSYTGSHSMESKLWGEVKKGYTHFASGDIAIAKITPCFENSKAVIFSNLFNDIGAGTTELHVARMVNKNISKRYILLYLKSRFFMSQGILKMTGSAGQKRLPKTYFSQNPIPFPPLQEQNRIVQKVDELMALCDQLEKHTEDSLTAHQTLVETLLDTLTQSQNPDDLTENWNRISDHFDLLFTTEKSIDSLKQTILQLAVMGKLVPQDPNDEPASVLLERIAVEKDRLVKEKKIKKQKALPEIGDDEKPFCLPAGWIWSRLGDIHDVTSSKRIHVKDYMKVGVPFFRSKEIGELGRGNKISTELFISRNQYNSLKNMIGFPQEGDLMLASIGGSIGNLWLCDDREFYYKDGNLTKLGKHVLSNMYYLKIFMESNLFWNQVTGGVSGSAYNALTIIKIKNLVFPLPPLAEQNRIVQKIDELMTLCEELKSNLTHAQDTQLKLTDAIVEKAIV